MEKQGLESYPRIGMVIPTRNRPAELVQLLKSIEASTVRVTEIVIVSSGVELYGLLREFSESLNIIYYHSTESGQVHQKRLAINLLSEDLDWCIFSDDDLIFESNAIENALNSLKNTGSSDIVGIGFALPATSRVKKENTFYKLIERFIFLESSIPGKVLKCGHASSYLESEKDIYTSWLNGVSMWRRSRVKNYGLEIPATRYAACEDLIFSFSCLKYGKLLFSSQAKIRFQHSQLTKFDSIEVFMAAAYFRMFFVQSSKQLSSSKFIYSQFWRTMYASVYATFKRTGTPLFYWAIFVQVFRQRFRGKQVHYLINKLKVKEV